MIKLLLIYLVLFFLLLQNTSVSGKGMEQAENAAGECTVEEVTVSYQTDVRSFDLHRYFMAMKTWAPSNQLDLSSENENVWNNLTYKILHKVSGRNVIIRMRTWYSAEWMKMLSVLHVKGFFVYFLGELII